MARRDDRGGMGRLILMGSGELAPSMAAVHREALAAAGAATVTVLDTPFGFQENADELTERIASFFERSLGVGTVLATLRVRGADEASVATLLTAVRDARYVFSGPGSPTYALDLWEGTGIGDELVGVIRRGGAVVLASAAALTAGTHTIPVYEIYKVGAAPFLRPGLDLLGALGIPAIVVPHWNNAEGGTHDTSRCFIGERRLRALTDGLDVGVLGIDEHTAAILDVEAGTLTAAGLGSVTLRGRDESTLGSGGSLSFDEVRQRLGHTDAPDRGTVHRPAAFEGSDDDGAGPGDVDLAAAIDDRRIDEIIAALLALEASAAAHHERRRDLRVGLVQLARAAEQGLVDPKQIVGDYVALLLELRAAARAERRFGEADRIRAGLARLGVEVRDTPDGAAWDLTSD